MASRRSTTPGENARCSSTSRTDLGVPLAKISEATRARIDAVLDPGLVAENPLDAWGTGIDADRIYVESFLALHDDPETAAVAFVVDLTRQGEPYDEGYLQVARDVLAATTKPFCVDVEPARDDRARRGRDVLRGAGIPVLEGTVTGLRALKHLLDDARPARRPTAVSPPGSPAGIEGEWRRRLSETPDLSEVRGARAAVRVRHLRRGRAPGPVAGGGGAGGRTDRIPRGGEDGGARDLAQVRCARRPAGRRGPR